MSASNSDLEAMRENDAKSVGNKDAVPGADSAHAHSPAAHLGKVEAHTKPVGDMRDVEEKEESHREFSRSEQGRAGR